MEGQSTNVFFTFKRNNILPLTRKMFFQSRVTHTACGCLVLQAILLWSAIKVCSGATRIHVTRLDEQQGIGTTCAIVNCSINFPTPSGVSHPLVRIEIHGMSVKTKVLLFTAYLIQPGYRIDASEDLRDHDIHIGHGSAYAVINVTNVFQCWTAIFQCFSRYTKEDHGQANEWDRSGSYFPIEDRVADIMLRTAKLTSIKLSRLTAEVESVNERLLQLIQLENSVNDVLGVVEPNQCIKGMEYSSDRTIVEMPGYPRVLCDTTTDSGGWIIFQRRMNGYVNMTRNFEDYKYGFGNPETDYWFGLEWLKSLLNGSEIYELRIDATYNRVSHFAVYDNLELGPNYQLKLKSWKSGKDPFQLVHEPEGSYWGEFDADFVSKDTCASKSGGGFWFKDEDHCEKYINPSGHWRRNVYGMSWHNVTTGRNKYLDTIELKIRRTS